MPSVKNAFLYYLILPPQKKKENKNKRRNVFGSTTQHKTYSFLH